MSWKRIFIGVVLLEALGCFLLWQRKRQQIRSDEIIYGRKCGMALTLDVLQPRKRNGIGIIYIVSGGFYSNHDMIEGGFYRPLLERGYTVFAVIHGSQPRFIIPEIHEDAHRAVRFIRYHAAEYGIDARRLGAIGHSAGAHLCLMLGAQGREGKADSRDPVERESSAIQCVACFAPLTDFLNYGLTGTDAVGHGPLEQYQAAFGPRSATAAERQVLGREISPIYFVHPGLPPVLIIHGDADQEVPIQQSETFLQRCREANRPGKLIVRKGKAHRWEEMTRDMEIFADWFDEHLRGVKGGGAL